MFALDTNTVIDAMKGLGGVREKLLQADPSAIAIPSVVLYELEFGTICSNNPARRRRDLKALLGAMDILLFDKKSAEHSAHLRRHLEKSGQRIGPYDNLIAGTALGHNAILVSHNVGEFSRVPGLQLEDWF